LKTGKSRITPEIIQNVRFLVSTFLLAAITIVSLILWQVNEHKKTNDLDTNYHTASTAHIDNIRYETLNIKANYEQLLNHKLSPKKVTDLNHHNIQSIHIIQQNLAAISSIQNKYQKPVFAPLEARLSKQLIPVLETLSASSAPVYLINTVDSNKLDAILLTLNQYDRLHKITQNNSITKARALETKRIITMITFVIFIALISAFITIRTFSSINNILRKQQLTEKTLLKEKTLIHTMLNSVSDAVVTVNEAGTILSFNLSAEELFACNGKEVIGKNIKQFLPEPFKNRNSNDLFQQWISNNAVKNSFNQEVQAIKSNGKSFPVKLSLSELPGDKDNNRRFVGSCHDLTELKQHEDQIRRTQKMDALGKLTGGIAHDYNNMLGVVTGYAELLEAKLNDQPKLAKYAHEIHHAGERGSLLTKKLLAFSSQDSPQAISINLNTLLLKQQHMLEKTLTARIHLKFDLQDELWPVYVDNSEMEDVILNMSINAMHAIEGNGELQFITRNTIIKPEDDLNQEPVEKEYVVLSIKDNGCGMDAAIQEKIFDPFYTTKGEKGTGLGLSQVYGFMERSAGSISVHSRPDAGSQFDLYFPRHYETDKHDHDNIPSEISTHNGHENILIVDDEFSLLSLTSELLQNQGYHVLCAESASQALDILKKESIDLLFSDIIMPEMDGYQLASIVRKKYPDIKIQLASGYADNSNAYLIEAKIQQNILSKPYNSESLLNRIRTVLDEE